MKPSVTLRVSVILYLTCQTDTQQNIHWRPIPIHFGVHTMDFGLGLWACPLLSLLKTKGMLFFYPQQYSRQIGGVAKCYEVACEVRFRKKHISGTPSLTGKSKTDEEENQCEWPQQTTGWCFEHRTYSQCLLGFSLNLMSLGKILSDS